MKSWIIFSFLIVLFHSACNYTFESGIEHSTEGAATIVASNEAGEVTTGVAGTLLSLQPGTFAPGAFIKTAPANGSSASTNPTLSWSSSSRAKGYFYCYDTIDNNACDSSWILTGMSTSAHLGGLANDTTYYWQVRAVTSGETTEANGGKWWSFTTPPSSPGAFTKSAPHNGDYTRTNTILSWSASSGAIGYLYCYDTTNNNACDASWIETGTSTSASLSGLTNSTTYYWQVIAGKSGMSTEADGGTWYSFTTLSPSSPGAFSKSAPANGSSLAGPKLYWKESSGVERYLFCLDTTNNNTCDTNWNDVGTTTALSLSKYGLTNNTTYYWQVRAVNSSSGYTEADGGVWWSFTKLPSPPGAFSKSAPANGSTLAVPKLYWTESSGAERYLFCFDTTNNNTCDTSWNDVGTTTALSLSKYGLTNNTTYYWQVRAYISGVYTEADGGTWWNFSTPSTSPGVFYKLSPGNGSLTAINPILFWSTSSGAISYLYCYDTTNDRNCDTSWVNVGTSTSVSLSGLTANTTYYWQVEVNVSGEYSHADGGIWWSFTTGDQTLAAAFIVHPVWQSIDAYCNAGITAGFGKEPLIYRMKLR